MPLVQVVHFMPTTKILPPTQVPIEIPANAIKCIHNHKGVLLQCTPPWMGSYKCSQLQGIGVCVIKLSTVLSLLKKRA